MRVIAGTARGKNLQALPGEDITRPTINRVKEAMFSSVQFLVPGARVLDLFAGSGQLGIEALSRGAKSCLFVDRSAEALAVVKANCKTAGVDRQSDIRQGEAESFLANIRGPFDLALLDPPFHHDTVAAVLPLLAAKMAPGGVVLCETEREADLPEQAGAEDAPRFEELREIELRNVSFAYPGMERKVLEDVSICMEKGKRYALIGVNGAGKSTLLKLMMRYYDSYTGEILINGQNVRELPYAVLKGFFGYVSQDSYHYTLTVRENLCMGETFDDGALMQALERMGLAQKVSALPQGLDTPLGRLSERDADLSGGEWQRQKSKVKPEEYNAFYKEKFGDWTDPLAVIHTSAEGAVTYKALLFIHSL